VIKIKRNPAYKIPDFSGGLALFQAHKIGGVLGPSPYSRGLSILTASFKFYG
jgi:hypothetical protein